MSHEDDRLPGMLAAYDGQRAVECLVVHRQVRDVMRGLPGRPRPAGLTQVQAIKGQAASGREVSQRALEEVVRETVHIKHGPARALARPGLAPNQHGADRALAVRIGTQLQYLLAVAVAQ